MSTLLELLTTWMPHQRWFLGAERPQLQLVGSYSLTDPEPDPDVHRIEVALITDHGAAGGPVVYQVPLTFRKSAPEACIGTIEVGGSPVHVLDGPKDPACARALLHLIASQGNASARESADPTRAAGVLTPGASPGRYASSRVLSGEQSNTSIIYELHDAPPLILKLYRTISDGENPDVTLQSALTAGGSARVSAVFGFIQGTWNDPRRAGSPAQGHLAFAQEFLAGVEDAWRVALRAAHSGQSFGDQAQDLGRATAETHLALRRALPTAEPSRDSISETIAGMKDRFDTAHQAVPELGRHRDAAFAAFDAAASQPWPLLQRIHGDYHLGQVILAPQRGWVLLDFEGEPLRSLVERNQLDVPIRDVAGMLRSFDYVAGSLQVEGKDQGRAWADEARQAFVSGYRSVFDPLDVADDAQLDPHLLAAYELDKAIYEVRYEALHRPDWVSIPLGAITRLLSAAS